MYLLSNDLDDLLPQKFAWNLIHEDLNNLFVQNALYDGASPTILQEKIWDTPLYSQLWSEPYFQVLGYFYPDDLDDLLIVHVLDRIDKHLSERSTDIEDESLSPSKRRAALLSCQGLLEVREPLMSLNSLTPALKRPRFRRRGLFNTIRDSSNLVTAQLAVAKLVDLVLSEYPLMLEANFPRFTDKFLFYGGVTNHQLLVEAAIMPDDCRTSINYSILPSTVNLPSNPMIIISHADWILQKVPMHSTSQEGLIKYGHGFGTSELDGADNRCTHR